MSKSWHIAIANLPLKDYAVALKEHVDRHFEHEDNAPHPYVAERQAAQVAAALAMVDQQVAVLMTPDQVTTHLADEQAKAEKHAQAMADFEKTKKVNPKAQPPKPPRRGPTLSVLIAGHVPDTGHEGKALQVRVHIA